MDGHRRFADELLRWAAAKRTLTELEGQPKENWRIRDHAIVFYQLFPNTVLTYTQDHCGVFTSFPVTPDESVMQFSVLVPPEEKADQCTLTGISRGLTSGRWGTLIVRIPFLYSALILSRSALSGSVKDRENDP